MKIFSVIFFMIIFQSLLCIALAQKLVVGTYTDSGLSKGIYIYDFDINEGSAKEICHVKTENPSYVTINKHSNFVYAVNEQDKGMISSFAFDKKNNSLSFINQQPTYGSAPCYITLDKTGRWLLVGNYGSGSFCVYEISNNGSIGRLQQSIQHSGSGVDNSRQQGPHVHCTYVGPDNKTLYVPDLGLDKVMVYPFDPSTGLLDTINKKWISVAPGGGPRHIIFSKNGKHAYLVEEMSGNVNVIAKNENEYKIVQTENHLPKGGTGAGADIHLSPDEKFLYVSQRSNSTIQIFEVDANTGSIKYISEQPTFGNFPRNFTIHPSGKYLLAANQKSNDITIFKIDTTTGLLTYTQHRIQVGMPVCLQWIGDETNP